jgi:AGZA family xanthine/uracil permease-like MFS transporter
MVWGIARRPDRGSQANPSWLARRAPSRRIDPLEEYMATASTTQEFRIRWWVPGDWNAFFGLFTNVALNVIVLSGLVLGVVEMPGDVVFGRILPALGIALPLGNLWYTYLAVQLAKKEGRSDVTAMPYGPSVPHMFIVVFLIMLPIKLQTGDWMVAYRAGLAWCFVIGVIVLIGAFIGPTIRKYTPRAAMLGTLAGVSLAFISMRPAFQSWEVPWIAFITLGLILMSWVAGIRLPWNMPAGLLAIIVGTVIAWVATMLNLTGLMQPTEVGKALGQFGLHLPIPGGEVLVGLAGIGPLLVTAIPLGIYNFTEGMNNVESAAAAGDDYNLRSILLADGIGAVVGAFLGSPFPPAVYIGHPGWKAIGGRIGYSLATGICVALVCFLGLVALLLAVIPLVAILPILLYIGIVITAQAFEHTPIRHAPAIVLALIPNLAAYVQNQIDSALNAAGTSAEKVGMAALNQAGVVYDGMAALGGGAILAGMVLGAIAAFVIDRDFKSATIYALAGAGLSLIGFIHGTQLGITSATSQIALGYLLLGAVIWGLSRGQASAPVADEEDAPPAAVPAEA